MFYLSGLNVNHVPRYDALESDGDISRAPDLVAQSALWSALRFSVVGKVGASVELRLTAHPLTREVKISVLIAAPSSGVDGLSVLRVLERLLPADYGWSYAPIVDGQIETPELEHGENWLVARLTRKITMFDLPMVLPWEILPGQKPSTASPGVPARDAGGTNAAQLVALAARVQKGRSESFSRRIPLVGVPWEAQRLQANLCVPMLSQLNNVQPQRLRLFEEMQQCAPIVVSIALHPVAARAIEGDRGLAAHLNAGLTMFGGAVEGSSPASDGVQATYSRYWAPDEQLCKMSLRVAGKDEYSALAVAHSLAAHFGGLRAFEIRSPSNPLERLDRLAVPNVDEGDHLDRWLTAERVECDAIYPPFLERMRHLYVLEEAEKLLSLPYAVTTGLPGVRTRPRPPFFPPSTGLRPTSEDAPSDRVRIGLARGTGLEIYEVAGEVDRIDVSRSHWHSIPVRDLCKHALIVGTTGSGKTVTTTFLVKEIERLQIPFLVVEPVKTEYFDNLSRQVPNLKRYRFEHGGEDDKASHFAAFDPLRLQRGVSLSRHVSYLKSCFEAAFPMNEVMSLILENGLREYYTRPRGKPASPQDVRSEWSCGLPKRTKGGLAAHKIIGTNIFPSFATFQRFFLDEYVEEVFSPKGGDIKPTGNMQNLAFEWKQIFKRRFDNLDASPLGDAFRRADSICLKHPTNGYDLFPWLLRGHVVLELDALTDPEQKAMAMAFVLTLLYERRQADDFQERERRRKGEDVQPTPPVRHVMIIEEAHRLLSSSGGGANRGESVGLSASAKAVSMFIDMLAEIRAYGQSLVIVEQIPKKIAPEVIKNTNLKIMLRLPSGEDRDYLGTAMNFDEEQKKFVASLRTGQFVCFEETVDQPILLQAPYESRR